MANSSKFADFHCIQAGRDSQRVQTIQVSLTDLDPLAERLLSNFAARFVQGSHSKFSEIFTDAFSDGQPPDIVFCALPETRFQLGSW
eukprot:1158002-Amphidinium_carterae.1